jgi:hypothetical protein
VTGRGVVVDFLSGSEISTGELSWHQKSFFLFFFLSLGSMIIVNYRGNERLVQVQQFFKLTPAGLLFFLLGCLSSCRFLLPRRYW